MCLGKSDPFCKLAVVHKELTEELEKDLSEWANDKVVEEAYTTATIAQTLEPEWNEEFDM